MDPYLGEIRIFPISFAPVGWAFCDGQLLPILQYQALFSLIGTAYGGDGQSNFALPNLRGSVPMSIGDGAGLSQRNLGDTGGSPTVTLITAELPQHTHSFSVAPAAKKESSKVGNNTPASGGEANLYSTATPTVTMNAAALAQLGSDQPHDNMQPYLTLGFCICMNGTFPPRG